MVCRKSSPWRKVSGQVLALSAAIATSGAVGAAQAQLFKLGTPISFPEVAGPPPLGLVAAGAPAVVHSGRLRKGEVIASLAVKHGITGYVTRASKGGVFSPPRLDPGGNRSSLFQ